MYGAELVVKPLSVLGVLWSSYSYWMRGDSRGSAHEPEVLLVQVQFPQLGSHLARVTRMLMGVRKTRWKRGRSYGEVLYARSIGRICT